MPLQCKIQKKCAIQEAKIMKLRVTKRVQASHFSNERTNEPAWTHFSIFGPLWMDSQNYLVLT